MINFLIILHGNNIPTMLFWTRMPKMARQCKSHMLQLTEYAWEFQNDALWDILWHSLIIPSTIGKSKTFAVVIMSMWKKYFLFPQYDTAWVWPWNWIFINLLTISLILVQIWLQQEIFLHSTLSMLLSNAKTQPYTADLTRPIYEAESYNIRNTNPIFLEF